MSKISTKEIDYTNSAELDHIKKFGQYFTNYCVADFMSKWVSEGATSLLDPAVGNSIFFRHVRKYNKNCVLVGYEIDQKILNYFGNPTDAQIRNEDYLLHGWDEKYDAIICNPPYNRFQAVSNRDEILKEYSEKLGANYSGYTNQYILFLLKSIHQMSSNGKLAYIIPTEFLNSRYGDEIKKKLVDERLIRYIINFKKDDEMFYNATTTCCILFLDKTEKDSIVFFNLDSPSDISDFDINHNKNGIYVKYEDINYKDKWRSFLNHEEKVIYNNLVSVSTFCSVSRGIATGANDFFCFNKSKAQNFNIPTNLLQKCITKSADIKSIIFTIDEFEDLSSKDKQVYILDAREQDREHIEEYIKIGEKNGINQKYLPSCRKPWFSMEQKAIAPIWVCSANRNSIKFVRNLALVKSLTTFHSVMINDLFRDYVDIIFCYFITPIAQNILRENRKELGNGLEKFQPNDLNSAYMLDVTRIQQNDISEIQKIFEYIKNKSCNKIDTEIAMLNNIFEFYLK